MSNLAGHADCAAMGFNNRLGNRQSHACSMNLVALPGAAVKLIEDKTLLQHADSNSAVGNAYHQSIFGFFRADEDRTSRRGIFRGVFQQMMQHLFNHAQIEPYRLQILGKSHSDRMRNNDFLCISYSLIHQLLHRMQLQVQLDFVSIQLCHLYRLFNQTVQTSALFVDDGEQFIPLFGRQLQI